MIPKRILLLTLFVITPSLAQLETGQQPPDIRWKMLDAPHFQLIFPEELATDAQQVANTLEYLRNPLQKTLESNLKKWPVVLTNRSTVANGYVTYLPRRTAWFATPPQTYFGGIGDWYQTLAIHEGRHMVQCDALDRGFNRWAGVVYGELGLGAFSFWGTPLWFLEGDAVALETALTNTGRGRLPNFDIGLRTLLVSDVRCSYYQAYLQSYKHYYADYYKLGYFMVTYLRRKQGATVWERVLKRSAKYSFWPFSFGCAMRKIAGGNPTQIYRETMDDLQRLWIQQVVGLEPTPVTPVNRQRKRVWTAYRYPQMQPDGTVIALKYGMADPHTLVRIRKDGTEKRLCQIAATERISVNGSRVVWCVHNGDRRWSAQSYSDVVVYDLKTARRREITQKGKYFSPALSPDGHKIAAVKFTPGRRCRIVLLDARTGDEIRSFPNPRNDFIKTPAWSADGERLAFTRQRDNQEALAILELSGGEQSDIWAAGDEDISNPAWYGKFILYGSPRSGIDNIYAVNISTGRRYQITSRKFGAYQPLVSEDGNTLLFADYQLEGLNVAAMRLDSTRWITLDEVEQRRIDYYAHLVAQEQGGDIMKTEKIPHEHFPVRDYSLWRDGLKLHSWYLLPWPPEVYYGFIAHDLLNSLALSAGVTHNINENTRYYSLIGSYAGWYPVVDAEVGWGQRALFNTDGESDVWDELSCYTGLRVPLDFSTGPYSTTLETAIRIGYTSVMGKKERKPNEIGSGAFLPLSYQINIANIKNSAYRDVRPRWGQGWQLYYVHTPGRLDYRGALFSSQLQLYLPGIGQHHSLLARVGLERQTPRNYYFQSRLAFPRGYSYRHSKYFYRAALDYQFPLLYPDLALGPILYFKRLRTNLFYDYGRRRLPDDPEELRSVGGELIFDLHPLTFKYLELALGIRYAYRIEDHRSRIDIFLANILF